MGESLRGTFRAIIYDDDADWQDHYPSPFRARRAVMLHAVRLGWALEECREVFTNPLNPGARLWRNGSDGRLLGAVETTKRLMADYERCSQVAQASPHPTTSAEARQAIGLARARAAAWAWPGRTGRTDRDVLAYVHRQATRIGCSTINVSSRDAALGAGVTRKTASASLRRLCAAGWLKPYGQEDFARAKSYRCSQLPHMDVSGSVTYMESFETPAAPDHEVWLRLGKAARALYSALDVIPHSARAMARRAGVAPATATRQLPRLAACGLALSRPEGWIVGPLGPDDVVEHQGWINGKSLREYRQQVTAEERRVFNWFYWGDESGPIQPPIQ